MKDDPRRKGRPPSSWVVDGSTVVVLSTGGAVDSGRITMLLSVKLSPPSREFNSTSALTVSEPTTTGNRAKSNLWT